MRLKAKTRPRKYRFDLMDVGSVMYVPSGNIHAKFVRDSILSCARNYFGQAGCVSTNIVPINGTELVKVKRIK